MQNFMDFIRSCQLLPKQALVTIESNERVKKGSCKLVFLSSFYFFFLSSFLAVMEKAGEKSELENSAPLNPSSILFSSDRQARSSGKELCSSTYIHVCAGKKKKKTQTKQRY